MQLSVGSGDPKQAAVDLLAVPFFQFEGKKWRLDKRFAALDRAFGGPMSAALRSGDFRGKAGQTCLLYPDASAPAKRLLMVGLGAEAEASGNALRRAAGLAVQQAARRGGGKVAFCAPSLRRVPAADAAQAFAEGAVLADYRFDRFQAKRENAPEGVRSFQLLIEKASDRAKTQAGVRRGGIIADSQNLARSLSDAPANTLPPVGLAREAQRMARSTGLRCQVLDVAQLKRRKMGGILAVGQGSANPPRLIVLEHNRAKRPKKGARGKQRTASLCFVGKGITFDSGGISIKPAANMHEMKHDMSGAAAVVGAMRAAALLKVPHHVVGIIAAAENLPSDTAYRPGDVVTSMAGKTIEVLNTDAEGRVVLVDALHFARTEFAPDAILDLATLTGACVVALGKAASGLMGNHEGWLDQVRRAGESCGERAWPLPLWDEHRELVRSTVADIKNTGGRDAGTSTAAAFLSYFTEGIPWAHLDIAGTANTETPGPYQGRGATGVGVRLIVDLLHDWRAL